MGLLGNDRILAKIRSFQIDSHGGVLEGRIDPIVLEDPTLNPKHWESHAVGNIGHVARVTDHIPEQRNRAI